MADLSPAAYAALDTLLAIAQVLGGLFILLALFWVAIAYGGKR